jgi:hypothetical protein
VQCRARLSIERMSAEGMREREREREREKEKESSLAREGGCVRARPRRWNSLRANLHAAVRDEGWMEKTVFCWVPVP